MKRTVFWKLAAFKSSNAQTEQFVYDNPMKNKTTQTCQKPTNAYLTNEYLTKKLVTDAVTKTQISLPTQTDQIENKQTTIDNNAHYALPNPTTELTELLDIDSELSE